MNGEFGAEAPSWIRRAGGIVSDVLIATALIWTLPLLVGLLNVLIRTLGGSD